MTMVKDILTYEETEYSSFVVYSFCVTEEGAYDQQNNECSNSSILHDTSMHSCIVGQRHAACNSLGHMTWPIV